MRKLLQLFAVGAALSAAPLAHAETPAPAARTIVLVRHGHYAADPTADPILGPGLTSLGVAQARLTGARLAGLLFAFDQVYASPLTRAQQSARVIAEDLPGATIETLPDLAECTPPTRQTAITAQMKAEDLESCAKQVDRVFAEHFKPASGSEAHELMVCHGNVIRYLITKSLHVDTEAWLEMSVGHTSLTVVRIEADGTTKLLSAGDVGHLPPNLQTGASGNPERNLDVPPAR